MKAEKPDNMVIGGEIETYTELTETEIYGIRVTLGQLQHRYIAYENDKAIAAVDKLSELPPYSDYFENDLYGNDIRSIGMVMYASEFSKQFSPIQVVLKNIKWYMQVEPELPTQAILRFQSMPYSKENLEKTVYEHLYRLYKECYADADMSIYDTRMVTLNNHRLTGEIDRVDDGVIVFKSIEFGTNLPVNEKGKIKVDGMVTIHSTDYIEAQRSIKSHRVVKEK